MIVAYPCPHFAPLQTDLDLPMVEVSDHLQSQVAFILNTVGERPIGSSFVWSNFHENASLIERVYTWQGNRQTEAIAIHQYSVVCIGLVVNVATKCMHYSCIDTKALSGTV